MVLPTLGRYRYVDEVLQDLAQQTVKPAQILIADGNPPDERQPEVYERYPDLPIEVLWIEQPGTCIPRNECLARAVGEYVWFVDDDSRIAPDNLEQHLRLLATHGADASVGPAYTRKRPQLHRDQEIVRCTFMDCGTTLVRNDAIRAIGGFDLQFNDRLAGEDGELGIRITRRGGLVLNNPLAKRFHYLAPMGGARASSNNVHRWKRFSLLPRPVPSIYYTGALHFDKASTREAVLLAWVLQGWRAREGVAVTRASRIRTLVAEIVALPLSVVRLARSIQRGRTMAREGARVPHWNGVA